MKLQHQKKRKLKAALIALARLAAVAVEMAPAVAVLEIIMIVKLNKVLLQQFGMVVTDGVVEILENLDLKKKDLIQLKSRIWLIIPIQMVTGKQDMVFLTCLNMLIVNLTQVDILDLGDHMEKQQCFMKKSLFSIKEILKTSWQVWNSQIIL